MNISKTLEQTTTIQYTPYPIGKHSSNYKETKAVNCDTYEYTPKGGASASLYSLSKVKEKSAPAVNDIYNSSKFKSTSKTEVEMICNRAKLGYDAAKDAPIIEISSDINRFQEAAKFIDKYEVIEVYDGSNPYETSETGFPKTIYTHDHQYFLFALTENYGSDQKSYYAKQGYTIDAYMIMGIGFGESSAKQGHSNPFGSRTGLSDSSVTKATNRAITALQACGLAKNEAEAKEWMESDPFYQAAAEVLSYMDNGYTYKFNLNASVYSSADQAHKNAEIWRSAVKSGYTSGKNFAYNYYK